MERRRRRKSCWWGGRCIVTKREKSEQNKDIQALGRVRDADTKKQRATVNAALKETTKTVTAR